jgi:hypothetical protein
MKRFPRMEGSSHADEGFSKLNSPTFNPLHDTTEGDPFFAVVPVVLSLWQTLCHLPSLLLAPLARNQYLKSVLLPTSRP